MKLISREQARKIDHIAIHELGIPGAILMENAGARTSELFLHLNNLPNNNIQPCHSRLRGNDEVSSDATIASVQRVLPNIIICCGKGNNGGDGYVIARYLSNFGFFVQIFLFAKIEEVSDDAKIHFDIVKKLNIPIIVFAENVVPTELSNELQKADWIIDALFGTGLTGVVRAPYAELIQVINNSKAKKLAVDIPSGLDCNTGQPLGCAIKTDYTATFIAMKKGFVEDAASDYVGKIFVIDIGIPAAIIEKY